MEKMKFHWKKDGNSGSFSVTANSVEECIRIAKEEIEENDAELVDYYSV